MTTFNKVSFVQLMQKKNEFETNLSIFTKSNILVGERFKTTIIAVHNYFNINIRAY